MRGLVVKNTGSWYTVKTDDGRLVNSKVKGNFRLRGIRSTNPVAVGDRVEIAENAEGTAFITEIQDRTNYIIRKSPNLSKQSHIIAANVDQALLVVTVNYPQTSTTFIDRFLASAEAYRVPVVLLFNKADLLCGDGIATTPSPSNIELYDPAVEHPDRTDQPITAPVQDYASLAALPAVRSMLTLIEDIARQAGLPPGRIIPLSARCRLGLPEVTSALTATAADFSAPASATLVTNLRHYQALREALTALTRSREALTDGVSTEFVTQDIREALYHIGTICGQVTTDEILGSIFSRFCIGK